MSGLEWAKELPRGARIHWGELDAYVLSEHRQILKLLGPEAAHVRTPRTIVSFIVLVPTILVGMAVFWSPIWGLATLAGDSFGIRDVNGAMAIPVAGASMIVSCLVMSGLLIRRAFTHGVGGPEDGSLASGHVFLSVLMLAGMIAIGRRQQPDGWEVWLVPTVLGIVLASINMFVARHPREAAGPLSTRPPPTAESESARRQRVRAAVATLPEVERARLLDDRQHAIDWLRMQGTVTPDEAARASRAELGSY